MNRKQLVETTNKQFHYNTSDQIRYRVNTLSNLLEEHPLTVEQILGKKLTYGGEIYKLTDLKYDIRKGYLKLGKKVMCEICDSGEAELHCLHRYLCLDCESGSRFRCERCNPQQNLYRIEYLGLEPTLIFSN